MDDDDLLSEILLRLPPLPSSLPRASLVCTRWRRLLTSRAFLRRFRAHHHRRSSPPLLGVFVSDFGIPSFTPILDPPDRIPSARFSLVLPRDKGWCFLGCRHGLLLLVNLTRLEVTVWDPATGDQRCVAFPPGFGNDALTVVRNAAVLRRGGHSGSHFKVVLLRADDVLIDHDPHVFASVYDSETGVWSSLISASITAPLLLSQPSIMVANSLYWMLCGYGKRGILEFDLGRESLGVIAVDADKYSSFQILRTEDSVLGLAILSDVSTIMQIWERKGNSDGVAGWTLKKSIELDRLLSLRSLMGSGYPFLGGHDEDGNSLFVTTAIGVFVIHLKSMQFRNIFRSFFCNDQYHSYRSLYTTSNNSSSYFSEVTFFFI